MIATIDIETTQNNVGDEAIGSFKASPFHKDNKVVLIGYKPEDGDEVTISNFPMIPLFTEVDILVGHNIKFDLHYMQKSGYNIRHWVEQGGQIWDTMVAEYVLSGQSLTTKVKGALSLDGLCTRRGMALKDDKIKEYFQAGIGSEDIPREELEPYLVHDVISTEQIALEQMRQTEERGILPLMINMMDATLATWLMEHNGMEVDRYGLFDYTKEIAKERDRLREELCLRIDNPDSPKQVSAYVFGGSYKTREQVPDGVFKSGKKKGLPKLKWVEKEHSYLGLVPPETYGIPKKAHGYDVSEEVLSKFSVTFVDILLRYRKLQKELSTYSKGFLSRIWDDGRIRPEYHTTRTETGRLSCSNPNMQNLTRSE